MNRLLRIGFVSAGHWTLDNEIIRFNLASHHTATNVLYSFISNGEIKYIGKTKMHLSQRMYGYQNPGPSQTTNIRVNEKIKELLQEEKPVSIFILVDNGLLKYGDFKINLAAGLEDTLIYRTNPIWNFSGKNKLEEDKDSDSEKLIRINNIVEITNQGVVTFEIKLGATYYSQGYFNVPQKYNDKFGSDKAIIQIQLGDNPKNIIQGYINRTSNSNWIPRIMGGKALSDWVQKNHSQDDILIVEILTNVSIKLQDKRKTTT